MQRNRRRNTSGFSESGSRRSLQSTIQLRNGYRSLLPDGMRKIVAATNREWTEKKMFGGDRFLIDSKCVLARISVACWSGLTRAKYPSSSTDPGAVEMMHGGRSMGAICLFRREDSTVKDLTSRIEKCLACRPFTKSGKK